MEQIPLPWGTIAACCMGTALIIIQCFTLWIVNNMRGDIHELKNEKDTRLCPVHALRMDNFERRLSVVESKGE